MRTRFPCSHEKASLIKFLVIVLGYSQTHAAIIAEVNVGTVCHVVHGRRFPDSPPAPPPTLFDPKE